MKNPHRRLLSIILAASLALYGCAARVPAGPGGPGRPGTPLENLLAWNAAIANANLTIAKGVIAANETALISVPTANAILTEQSRIADANRQLTFIFQKVCSQTKDGKLVCGQAEQIRVLLEQTRASAKKLVSDIGIKDSKTAQLVTTNASAVLSLAAQIMSLLTASGVLKADGSPIPPVPPP